MDEKMSTFSSLAARAYTGPRSRYSLMVKASAGNSSSERAIAFVRYG